MVSITLSVPEFVKKKMNEYNEINWSGFVRKCILEKTEELSWKEAMLRKLKGEKNVIDWSVKLARLSKKGRFDALNRKGLF